MKQKTRSHQVALGGMQSSKEAYFFARFGQILSFDEGLKKDENQHFAVKVDFEGNPFEAPLLAKLGRAFRKNEIELAINTGLSCRIDFINGDVRFPIVTDIFFSLLSSHESLILRAEKIVIEASKELIVQSGETKTRYSGTDNRITTEAKYVTSQAQKAHKIQGGTISIN